MNKLALTLASVAALSLAACAESDTVNDDAAMTDDTAADQMAVDDAASGTIVEVAQAAPQLTLPTPAPEQRSSFFPSSSQMFKTVEGKKKVRVVS